MMRTRGMAWLVAVMVLAGASAGARAGVVTYTFGAGENGLSTITQTQSGITLTLSNPTQNSTFVTDNDGIFLGQSGIVNSGFDLAVTGATLTFTGYSIQYVDSVGTGAYFSLYGGSGSSSSNSIESVGTFTANGSWTLAPGQVGSLEVGAPGIGFAELKTLTFSFVDPSAVPEPGTVGLALAGAGVLGLRAWRRRGARAAA